MLKWISDIASPRQDSVEDQRKKLGDTDDSLMIDLVVSEVEHQVTQFETNEERRKSHVSTGRPDYSWLVTDPNMRPKKWLTPEERSKLEEACERMKPDEWSTLMTTWKGRTKDIESRQQIFDIFLSCVQEVLAARPRQQSIGDVLRRYLRSESSMNSVDDSPRYSNPLGSTRSLADIHFRDFTDVV
ncbi:unnamed protein product, partial [Mesorhabditis belari]|uniref:Uncharacterized protein n=1 Tax=Mesorhabditis belari TaxID=2138241 RepID=A0AAF3FCI7_9BILA